MRQIVQVVIVVLLSLLRDKGDSLRVLHIVVQGVRVIFFRIVFETACSHHVGIEVVEIIGVVVFGRAIYCGLLCVVLGKLEQFSEFGADVGPLLLRGFEVFGGVEGLPSDVHVARVDLLDGLGAFA